MNGMNPLQFMQQYNEYRHSLKNKNPKQLLDSMIKSGQINESQLKQAEQMASMIRSMMSGKR